MVEEEKQKHAERPGKEAVPAKHPRELALRADHQEHAEPDRPTDETIPDERGRLQLSACRRRPKRTGVLSDDRGTSDLARRATRRQEREADERLSLIHI